jgi:hypothetical protein
MLIRIVAGIMLFMFARAFFVGTVYLYHGGVMTQREMGAYAGNLVWGAIALYFLVRRKKHPPTDSVTPV